MLRSLCPRWRTRIALVAIAALLWSQVVLAGHAGCLRMLAQAAPGEVAAMDHECGGKVPYPEQPVCAAHCSQGDASAESGRIPPLPSMPAAPAIPFISVAVLADGVDGGVPARMDSSPPPSWHRPTAHPAALLLI